MTAHQILSEVAAKHGLTISDIKSSNRADRVVTARAEFIRRAYVERKLSDGQIGRMVNLTTWTVRYWRNPEARDRKITRYAERKRTHVQPHQ